MQELSGRFGATEPLVMLNTDADAHAATSAEDTLSA